MDDAYRGDTALNAGKYEDAIVHYTKALEQNPNAVNFYIKRSTANQRVQKHEEALSDAEIAVVLANKRGKRELISQAQLRRGIALFHLSRYGDAGACFGLAEKYNASDKSVGIWKAKVQGKLNSLSEDDVKREVLVGEVPDVAVPEAVKKAPLGTTKSAPESSNPQTTAAPVDEAPQMAAAQTAPLAQTPASKIRHEWYQNNDSVILTLLIKGAPADKVVVDVKERSVSISFPLQTGSTFDFSLDPLYSSVDPDKSKHRVLSTKIEITLHKSVPGQKWSALEGSADTTTTTSSPQKQAAPAYPTSSRSGPKNWEKIANSYVKPKNSDDSKDAEGDDGNDKDLINDYDEGGDEVNAFFKQIYANADDDTKRAMMKSFQESGGTSLSTNWSEVKNKTFEPEPPEGMVAKKWEI